MIAVYDIEHRVVAGKSRNAVAGSAMDIEN
jgi:hypothetical protein